MSSSQYMRSNPLNQHNAPLAVSSKDGQGLNNGTGNMYQGQGGRAFPQSGGGMSQFYSAKLDGPESAIARGSYAPVAVGYNSLTRGGRRRGRSGRKNGSAKRKHRKSNKKCDCDIVTGVGGRRRSRSRSRSRICHIKNCKCICHTLSGSRKVKQHGGNGGYGNAAYSIAGPNTGITKDNLALANPPPYTAYNSCHPVA